jgi:hypothetical protein
LQKNTYILALLLLFVVSVRSQVSTEDNLSDSRFKGITYRKEMGFEAKLHTNGWALSYIKGDIKTYYSTYYYDIGLGAIRHPRELSQTKTNTVVGGELPESFKFGKQNSVYVIRGSKGAKKYITDKAKRKGVSIGYNYAFGPSIAVIKPYYLFFVEQRLVQGELKPYLVERKYSEETRADFEDYAKIYGRSSFFKGLKEIKFTPGVQAKAGVFFSVGAFDKYAKALEVGTMLDLYTKKIPLMIENEAVSNSPYFLNFYVNLHFGKRSN